MYGVIFDLLRDFVIERHGGRTTWNALLQEAGFGYRIYFPVGHYPDEDMLTLAITASRMFKQPLPRVLEDFGHFVGPSLLSRYSMMIRPQWRTFEVLENAGTHIYDAQRQHAQRNPPQLRTVRHTPERMTLAYHSERKLCAMAKGIVRGLADHFGENIDIREIRCVFSGADHCEFDVSHRSGAADNA